jgi:hypothetical protein
MGLVLSSRGRVLPPWALAIDGSSAPHSLQVLASSAFSAPHLGQNMETSSKAYRQKPKTTP